MWIDEGTWVYRQTNSPVTLFFRGDIDECKMGCQRQSLRVALKDGWQWVKSALYELGSLLFEEFEQTGDRA